MSDQDDANYIVVGGPQIDVEKYVAVAGFVPAVEHICDTLGKPVSMTFDYEIGTAVVTEQDASKAFATTVAVEVSPCCRCLDFMRRRRRRSRRSCWLLSCAPASAVGDWARGSLPCPPGLRSRRLRTERRLDFPPVRPPSWPGRAR